MFYYTSKMDYYLRYGIICKERLSFCNFTVVHIPTSCIIIEVEQYYSTIFPCYISVAKHKIPYICGESAVECPVFWNNIIKCIYYTVIKTTNFIDIRVRVMDVYHRKSII